MQRDQSGAALGESGASALRSNGDARQERVDVHAAENPVPVIDTTWDPYQVWLTRVKQPREQSALRRVQPRPTTELPVSTDLSDTARLRILTPAGPG